MHVIKWLGFCALEVSMCGILFANSCRSDQFVQLNQFNRFSLLTKESGRGGLNSLPGQLLEDNSDT